MNRYPNSIAARLDDDSYLFYQTLRSMTETGSWGELLRTLAADPVIRERAMGMLNEMT